MRISFLTFLISAFFFISPFQARADDSIPPENQIEAAPVPSEAPKDLEKRNDLNVDNLIGTNVALELITGRTVLGVLERKTDIAITLNVPGLGPLDYPIENVQSIKPAP